MKRPLLIPAALLFGCGNALGQAAPSGEPPAPGAVPLPFMRPAEPARLPAPFTVPPSAPAPRSGGVLVQALDALTADRMEEAIAIRNRMAPDSLERKALTFAIATSGGRGIGSGEIAAAQKELRGWPGLRALRALSERAFLRDNPAPARIVAAFGNSRPQTTEGAIILARGLAGTGRQDEARQEIRRLWRGEALDRNYEDIIQREFGALLSAEDHRARMVMLMYRERGAQAQRFAESGGAAVLYRIWAAAQANDPNMRQLLAQAGDDVKASPEALFAQVLLLRKQRNYREAAKLLLAAPRERAAINDARAWWNERRIVARGLADEGDFTTAYALVAGHSLEDGAERADAEFHAGWYALQNLQDAEKARRHFLQLLAASSRPVSVSRALYWLGRTAEKGAGGTPRDYFTEAAQHSGTFYGQLAAARLGGSPLALVAPQPGDDERQRLMAREPVKAIVALEDAGHARRARLLYRALAEELQSSGELALLAQRAESNGDHALSLDIGKIAAQRGMETALAFPLGVIPDSAEIGASGKALAYAIARQESGFNPGAVSPANARGLLQLLPATAQQVAKARGIAFEATRLTGDAGYNATLGAHYLGEQIDRFSGSYILTFIAYNAGPRRVGEWIARYGDPRGKDIDSVVDWIERIPFPETRSYVQRVMENYQVYKSLLGEPADIEADLRFGRR